MLLVLYPTVIAPLFNKFEPLPDEDAEVARAGADAALRLCRQGPVRDGRQQAVRRTPTRTSPAWGAAKRVVFFDTLLSRLTPGEVEAVLAHELGHFRHRHVLKRMVAIFAASLAGLALLGWLATQSGFYAGLGVAPNLAARQFDALALAAVQPGAATLHVLPHAAVCRTCRAGTSSKPTPTPVPRPMDATWRLPC